MDGDNLSLRPWEEMSRIETYLGVEQMLGLKQDYFFNTTKGFYCHQVAGCLPDKKGRRHPEVRRWDCGIDNRQKFVDTFFF